MTPRAFFTFAASLLLTTTAWGCSVDPSSETPNGGGASGTSNTVGGGAGWGAVATGGASAGATNGGAGGSLVMAGGTSGAGGGSGAVGAGGVSVAGGAGGAGTGGMSFWGPGGPKKQFACPGEPYPAQSEGQATEICVGFDYNYGYNEGPTWIASENAFFFSNFIQGSDGGGDIIKYTLGGACEVWLHDVGCNGLAVSPSGNLLAACHGPRAVLEYDVETKEGRVVAAMAGGKMLDSPNDLVARSDGNVYFSNTIYELGDRSQGLGTALVRIDPLGVTSVIQTGGLNGVALSPDETKLHVVGMGTWQLNGGGVPGEKGGPDPGGDGIAVDCAGAISSDGTNSAFGGPDGKTLLVVGGGTNAKTVAMSVPGLP